MATAILLDACKTFKKKFVFYDDENGCTPTPKGAYKLVRNGNSYSFGCV